MNYYEHHIGDYAEATQHLTFVEDAAYSRLIRKYYAQEKPLPADIKAVQRLVAARTKEEREAVQTVLEEFFTLEDDGWHNARCDAEIAQYLAGEPEREVRKANESNRLKRHREERAELFKRLTDIGQHAPWNIGITELREMVKRLCETSAETYQPPFPATAPATPATATQTPIPNTQNKNTLSPAPAATSKAPDHDPRLDTPGLKALHPDTWEPDPKRLATELRIAGVPMPNAESLKRSLRKFNLHNAGKPLTVNQQYGKLAAWLEEDHRREQQRTPAPGQPAAASTEPRTRPLTAVERVEAARDLALGRR